MKKDRNSFFQESQVYNQTQFPMNPQMNVANQPFMTQAYQNQSFYAGPQAQNPMPLNYNIPQGQNQNLNYDFNDLEARLSKIERQLNRLDARITKLENGSFYLTDEVENTTNNVYMV